MEENRLVVNEMSKATGSADSRNLKKVNINPKKKQILYTLAFLEWKKERNPVPCNILTL